MSVNGRPTNILRRKSAIQSGKQDTVNVVSLLGLRVRGMMDKSLEKEIQERERIHLKASEESNFIEKFQHRGQHILHGKIALLLVVLLNICDCTMVVGGLILELNVILVMSQRTYSPRIGCNNTGTEAPMHVPEEKVAHALHYASIAILSVLLLETIVKILCCGKNFFKHKFEVFDAVVVTASFIVDVYYVKGTTTSDVYRTAQVLSFILPWRIVRVINSMVVALRSHAHIQLLLLYKSKQYLQRQLDAMSDDLEILRRQLSKIKEIAIEGGIPNWHISKILADIFMESREKRNAVKTMVAMAMASAVNQNKDIFSTRDQISKSVNSFKYKLSIKKRTSNSIKSKMRRRSTETNISTAKTFKDKIFRTKSLVPNTSTSQEDNGVHSVQGDNNVHWYLDNETVNNIPRQYLNTAHEKNKNGCDDESNSMDKNGDVKSQNIYEENIGSEMKAQLCNKNEMSSDNSTTSHSSTDKHIGGIPLSGPGIDNNSFVRSDESSTPEDITNMTVVNIV